METEGLCPRSDSGNQAWSKRQPGLLGKQTTHYRPDSSFQLSQNVNQSLRSWFFHQQIWLMSLLLSPYWCSELLLSKLEKVFLVKLQLGRFLSGQSPRAGLANTLSRTAAMVVPAATRSASNATLHLLLTRELAHAGSSLPKPDCLSAHSRPTVHILLKLRPNPESQQSHLFHPFPSKPAQLQ